MIWGRQQTVYYEQTPETGREIRDTVGISVNRSRDECRRRNVERQSSAKSRRIDREQRLDFEGGRIAGASICERFGIEDISRGPRGAVVQDKVIVVHGELRPVGVIVDEDVGVESARWVFATLRNRDRNEPVGKPRPRRHAYRLS